MARYLLNTTIFALILSLPVFAQTGWTIAPRTKSDTDLNAVYFADEKHGWTGGDNGFIAWTIDGGLNWTRQFIGTDDTINDVYFRNREKGYALVGERIFASADGGQIWREEKIFKSDEFGKAKPELYSIRFADKKNGWLVGSVSENDKIIDSLVMHTEDGGQTWKREIISTKAELIHLDFANDKRGWIVGANGTILSTRDGGKTWQKQSSTNLATLYHVDFANNNLGWAVGDKGLILRTEDGGERWLAVNSNVTRTLLNVSFSNDKTGFVIGRGGTILRSEDGGKSWIRQASPTDNGLFGLHIDKKFGWAVGAKGVVLKYAR